MDAALLSATIYLLAAVVAVPLATRLGLGSVLGYLLAGIAIGPVLGLVGAETSQVQHVAEFGVVMMLFLIGLELEPRALWDMRRKLIGLGGLQVALTAGAVAGVATLLGLEWRTALTVGAILALSSTAIVLQTLDEKGLMQTGGGRNVFSVLLTQDIAVIPMLALIPLLAVTEGTGGDGHAAPAADAAAVPAEALAASLLGLTDGMPAWGVTLATLAAVGAVILAGVYLIPAAFRFIDRAGLREMYTAFALLLVVGIATLMNMVGLSPALGTFLAGVVLAGSEFRHQLESDIEPFKGLLLGLFFITVGAGIDFGLIAAAPMTLLSLTLGLMALKAAILLGLALAFGLGGRDRALFTLSLAQAGEFGFVLVAFARGQGALPGALPETLLVVVALSMLLTPLFFILYEAAVRRMGDESEQHPPDEVDHQGEVLIAGVGRFGQVVNRLVSGSGFATTVLDADLSIVQTMRRFGFRTYLGDPTRPEVLEAAGLRDAAALVVAVDVRDAATRLVREARRRRPDLHIVARARDRLHVYELYEAGADDIVREMFDSSLRAGRYVLEHLGLTDYEAARAEQAFYAQDRHNLRELADVWDPDVPLTENAAYMARAREGNRQMEAAIMASLQESRKKDAAGGTPPEEGAA
ncbi:Kef-type potassium/proton antiporter (CPA2 family) [Hasllibacter halocynthiae]|uniref:Kef-type potassium/proton antiporter (CPA2 family) n=1 Tax=Hasllibacter halocynthiae TaxID=595589 RepID=A0A2T0X751_9RHOB|nr:cation:proton antiporter [Hasllibacter halocynthiae]PRY94757.1 Kef-type potassium/proton antiporter (CPA2 family) [Hasllibacter halocynthiae]